jgi:hypothetical protein
VEKFEVDAETREKLLAIAGRENKSVAVILRKWIDSIEDLSRLSEHQRGLIVAYARALVREDVSQWTEIIELMLRRINYEGSENLK